MLILWLTNRTNMVFVGQGVTLTDCRAQHRVRNAFL
jgi:hypothetical protein